jgi:hypothetical protein
MRKGPAVCDVGREPGREFSVRMKQRSDRATGKVTVQDSCPALALRGILARERAAGQIVSLAYFVRQPAVDQRSASTTEFSAPGPILGLVSQDLIQARGREVIVPK